MNLKRYIALTLCALYIAATASVSLASLTCGCRGMMRSGVPHRCSSCCQEHPAEETLPCGGGLLGTGCDCDLHSTEIDLYTSSHSNDPEKYIRCMVSILPPSLVAGAPVVAQRLLPDDDARLRPEPFPDEVARCGFGLRAPPVRG